MSIAQQMQQLYNHFGELPGISIELHKNLLAVSVENKAASATVFLQGAQISHYQLHDQPPILWCSPLCNYQQGNPLRGGIPVCWPWFGDLERNPKPVQQYISPHNQAPAHGTARGKPWQLDDVEVISDHLTRLTLSLHLAKNEDPYWPHASTLQLSISVGQQLQMQLHIQNDSPQTVAFATALHSYFAISDIAQVTVNGLEALNYIDCLQNWTTQTQHGPLTINQETDRIYKGTHNEITLVDSHWQRAINIRCENSQSAVVWNPWLEKSKRLSQFADDAYRYMLCIETANIMENYICLNSGESHQLALNIRQTPLS